MNYSEKLPTSQPHKDYQKNDYHDSNKYPEWP